jgi:hypothetical protein
MRGLFSASAFISASELTARNLFYRTDTHAATRTCTTAFDGPNADVGVSGQPENATEYCKKFSVIHTTVAKGRRLPVG